jgi:hypothetical protein
LWLPRPSRLLSQWLLDRIIAVQSLARRKRAMRRMRARAHAAFVITRSVCFGRRRRHARAWRRWRHARERVAAGVMQRAVRRHLLRLRNRIAAKRVARVMGFSLQVRGSLSMAVEDGHVLGRIMRRYVCVVWVD